MTNINTEIAMNQTNKAIRDHVRAFSHKLGDIFSSCMRIKGAGNAQSFKESDNCLALADVNEPSI
jgi:hypothetical protein